MPQTWDYFTGEDTDRLWNLPPRQRVELEDKNWLLPILPMAARHDSFPTQQALGSLVFV